jgi:hydrogenase maturation protease
MTGAVADAGRVRRTSRTSSDPVRVEVLICGSPDRGDDGAAFLAAPLLSNGLPTDVRLRMIGQLDIDDLLGIPAGAAAVVVDAATGIRPGRVVSLPLDGLVGRGAAVRPRSSHALAFPEVVGLAALIRGRPVRGRIVAIGVVEFNLGAPLSQRVSDGIPALVDAVHEAIEHLRVESPARAET